MQDRSTSSHHGVVLGVFALLVTTLLAITHSATKGRIAANELAQRERTIFEVLPQGWQKQDTQDATVPVFDQTDGTERVTRVVRHKSGTAAVIISTSASNGYSGSIDLLISILEDGTLSGVRVVRHSETPGLGDTIEIQRSDWIKGFNGRSFSASNESQWDVHKYNGEFDQFTGATITPRAVVHEVANTLRFFNTAKDQIFNNAPPINE